jgi:N-acetylmuramoyl-L-alanine amidase
MGKLAPVLGAVLFLWMMCLSTIGLADSSANPSIQLIVEGKQVQTDVPPQITESRTFVPIRVIATTFNCQVDWDNDARKVTIQGDSIHLTMQIGNKDAVVNGKEVAMDVPPMIAGGRTLVPLRFVGESLGTTVGWEQDTQSVIVNKTFSVDFGGNKLDSDVYKLDGDAYVPLSQVAAIASVAYPGPSDDQKIAVGGQTIKLDTDGKSILKLRKIGDQWFIPLSVAQKKFVSSNSTDSNNSNTNIGATQLLSIQSINSGVAINTSAAVAANNFTLADPYRIVLDFPNTVISDQLRNSKDYQNGIGIVNSATSINPFINQIRYSQFDPTTARVVLELNQKAKYTINSVSNGLQIAFQIAPPKQGFLVVLDAGHGGKDTGAIGITGNYEKDLTLAVEKVVKVELLKHTGFQVVETRSGDSYPTLQDRVQIAQDANADLFLSIHGNSFDPAARGTETYYYTSQSEALATIVHKHLVAATGFPDRGAKTSGFYVIKNTTMPSNLVELGFLTNAIEDQQMLTPEFQQRVGKALADAIYEYYTSNK